MHTLSETRRMVWDYCVAHVDDEGYVRPLQRDIADALGVSRQTVSLAVRELRAAGKLQHVGKNWERIVAGDASQEGADEQRMQGSYTMAKVSLKRQALLRGDEAMVRRLYEAACARWGELAVRTNLTRLWDLRCIWGMQEKLPFGAMACTNLSDVLWVAREVCQYG